MTTPKDKDRAVAEVKHTPLPWAQSHRENDSGMFNTEIYDGDGETIATLAWYPVDLGNGTIATAREANAALIVEAVNAHPALLARVGELETALEPFVKAFAHTREQYAKRYGKDYEQGLKNFDAMPGVWQMESLAFAMDDFRRALAALKPKKD
jgi:hypothetical protein